MACAELPSTGSAKEVAQGEPQQLTSVIANIGIQQRDCNSMQPDSDVLITWNMAFKEFYSICSRCHMLPRYNYS